jgi:hypothetical protein
MFKLDIINTNKKGKLAAWSSTNGISYIKNTKKTIYNTSYVLDLSFLNIPFIIINI